MHALRFAAMLAATTAMAAPAMAAESPLVGTWDTIADTQMGKFEATMTIANGGDAYTVDIKDAPMAAPGGGGPESQMPPMESEISDVKVDGSALSFKRTMSTPQGPMELTYSLTVDGDSLSGEANSAFGAVPISGTRR
ncbi:hypothetical protein FHS61_000528 [Altererythrobacter atlanticus]|uniref:Uncharacterized protein n=1 Tax=Croceibacterium atlanticum TaxID=1267766 RepID=A0A0F7KT28_9SPHN|nr:hypothetical protein [Croceibacterium atlanticum]AKH42754.1 hypothetical protein WYH_01718 [Croceibacterium atlanticum]MBB5731535.1 hypothetical protein [Croceibacterium atlanticum]